MTTADLIPIIRDLSRADKIIILQVLASEIAKEEGVTPIEKDVSFSSVTLYNSHQAARQLEQLLEEHREAEND